MEIFVNVSGISLLFCTIFSKISSGSISNSLNSLRGKSVVKSGDGSLINSLGTLWFEQEFSHVVDYNNGMFGKPYCSTGKMADLGTGFYLIKNGSIGLEFAFESEINQVREWLERGVYYA